ncbi:MAG TPA: hypothetical protein VKA15_04640 [Isosphaeraceae bacterium]|nr:hypothetical protein [Isosphaeraceae bacterium]
MNPDSRSTPSPELDAPDETTRPSRLFLLESGWRISIKTDSQRAFCFMMAPGQDFYHGLLDGEVFVQRGEQRFCIACAIRRGLIALQPRRLPEIVVPGPTDLEPIPFAVDAERIGPTSDWRFDER